MNSVNDIFMYISVCLSIYLSVQWNMFLSCLLEYLAVCLINVDSVCLIICPLFCLSVCLSLCVSVTKWWVFSVYNPGPRCWYNALFYFILPGFYYSWPYRASTQVTNQFISIQIFRSDLLSGCFVSAESLAWSLLGGFPRWLFVARCQQPPPTHT